MITSKQTSASPDSSASSNVAPHGFPMPPPGGDRGEQMRLLAAAASSMKDIFGGQKIRQFFNLSADEDEQMVVASPTDNFGDFQVKQEHSPAKEVPPESGLDIPLSPANTLGYSPTGDGVLKCDSSTIDTEGPLKEEDFSDGNSSDDGQERTRRLCMVCGDLASGYHYGIASCEACKAFFKRTVQGNLKYKCHGKKNCEVSKKCRKACQSCRYKKCIRMGMMITGVRHDRLRGGRQKYRRKPEEKDFAPAPSSKVAKYKRVEDLIELLKKIEPAITTGLTESRQQELSALPTIIRVVSTSTMIADKALINTVAWAKQIPGFKKLHLEDQMLLLQENWMEVLVWRICFRSLHDEVGNRAVVVDGVYVTRELSKQTDTEHSFDMGMSLIKKCRELNLDYQEFLLMKVILFLNIDSPKIKDHNTLLRLQNTMFDALHHYTNRKNPGDARRAYRLLTSLPTLRQIASESVDMVARGSAENNIPLEHLHREMVEGRTSHMPAYRNPAPHKPVPGGPSSSSSPHPPPTPPSV